MAYSRFFKNPFAYTAITEDIKLEEKPKETIEDIKLEENPKGTFFVQWKDLTLNEQQRVKTHFYGVHTGNGSYGANPGNGSNIAYCIFYKDIILIAENDIRYQLDSNRIILFNAVLPHMLIHHSYSEFITQYKGMMYYGYAPIINRAK